MPFAWPGSMAERPRYINLIVLLRITCEAAATVLLVAFLWDDLGLKWGLVVAAALMVVVSFVVIGVAPRTLGRQHAYSIALASARSAARHFGVCSHRSAGCWCCWATR